MKLFLSYSHKDAAIAIRVESFLSAAGIKVCRDETILTAGDPFESKLLDEVAESDGCILLISRASMDSNFIKKEVKVALDVLTKRKNYKIYPIKIEYGIKPKSFPQLEKYHWEDMSLPECDSKALTNIIKGIKKRASNHTDSNFNYKKGDEALSNQKPDYDRIIGMMKEVFSDEIKSINSTILSHDHIFTPKTISIKEQEVGLDVYVVTKHLKNDTQDPAIRNNVKRNIDEEGIKYTYLVFSSRAIDKELKEYYNYYVTKNGVSLDNVTFYKAPKDFIMPSSEIVIYDPSDEHKKMGYFQVNYPKDQGNNQELFYAMPSSDINHVIYSLEKGIKEGRFEKIDISNV